MPSVNIIKFENLDGELTMPMLLKLGHLRQHITQLFEELDKKGFGNYIPGKRGKGNCARFVPNESCPKTYTVFSATKTQTKKAPPIVEKEVETKEKVQEAPKKDSEKTNEVKLSKEKLPIVEEKDLNTQTLHSLWALSKNLVEDLNSNFVGYRCVVFANQLVVVHRVRGGGSPSIQEAVKKIFSSIENRIVVKKGRSISKIEAISSGLAGSGFFVLCPVDCTCGEK